MIVSLRDNIHYYNYTLGVCVYDAHDVVWNYVMMM